MKNAYFMEKSKRTFCPTQYNTINQLYLSKDGGEGGEKYNSEEEWIRFFKLAVLLIIVMRYAVLY